MEAETSDCAKTEADNKESIHSNNEERQTSDKVFVAASLQKKKSDNEHTKPSWKYKSKSQQYYYNILLLGPTGVGKSTFINSFVNYLSFKTLHEARSSTPTVLIPSKFVVTDENFDMKVIEVGTDKNEHDTLGDSATQFPKCYTFPLSIPNKHVRFLDTPGIADTRGIQYDEINCENILRKIAQYEELHAICLILTPNNSRITAEFEFCIKQLLSQLEKSASKNIVFIFTNSRGTFYRPGDTLPPLKRVLQSIKDKPPHVDVALNNKNIFCMDNEGFRFLMAARSGVKFSKDESKQFEVSWERSRQVAIDLLFYIMGDKNSAGLVPHLTKDTISVNEARKIILKLSKPLADISQLIYDNVYAVERQMHMLTMENKSIEELSKNLSIPIIDIKEITFNQPRTVCTAHKCSSVYMVNGIKKYHYSQRCHNPCNLTNVPAEIIGSPELIHCAAMKGTRRCQECGCDFTTHMHIYYETETFQTTISDENVATEINKKETVVRKIEAHIDGLKQLKEEYETEQLFIIQSMATFASFLKNNAIAPYNDAYKAYIKYLINREKSLGDDADDNILKNYEEILARYDEYCNILNKVAQDCDVPAVSATKIEQQLQELFQLKHFGQRLKSLYYCQEKAFESERHDDEYIHRCRLKLYNARGSQSNNFGRGQSYRQKGYQNRQYNMRGGRNSRSQDYSSVFNQQEADDHEIPTWMFEEDALYKRWLLNIPDRELANTLAQAHRCKMSLSNSAPSQQQQQQKENTENSVPQQEKKRFAKLISNIKGIFL